MTDTKLDRELGFSEVSGSGESLLEAGPSILARFHDTGGPRTMQIGTTSTPWLPSIALLSIFLLRGHFFFVIVFVLPLMLLLSVFFSLLLFPSYYF